MGLEVLQGVREIATRYFQRPSISKLQSSLVRTALETLFLTAPFSHYYDVKQKVKSFCKFSYYR